jgi:hypothetical protein
MYPYRTTKPRSAKSIELRAVENERKAHWFFTIFKWLAGATGCLAVFVLVAGLRQASTLSTQERPGVGPGFSEATTAAIAGATVRRRLLVAVLCFRSGGTRSYQESPWYFGLLTAGCYVHPVAAYTEALGRLRACEA